MAIADSSTAAITVGIVSVFLGGLVYSQRSLLYVPFKTRYPKPKGIQIDDVFFKTSDGVRIHGWLSQVQTDRPTVLMFHGNAGDVNARGDLFLTFARQLRASLFIIDYRGYGQSDNVPISEMGLIQDAHGALRHLRDHLGHERVVLYGRSLGGAVALGLLEEGVPKGVEGVILENTFTTIPSMAKTMFPFLGPFIDIPGVIWDTWRSIDRIKRIPPELEVLFISSQKDEIVPKEHMKALWDASEQLESRYWFPLPDRRHDNTWDPSAPTYTMMLDKWHGFLDRCSVSISG